MSRLLWGTSGYGYDHWKDVFCTPDGVDAYAFFNNDYLGHAPSDAARLAGMVGE